MKLKELEDLDMEILIPLLRGYGIKNISIGAINIGLGEEVTSSYESSKFEDEAPLLSCGHSLWESNEVGECLHGCTASAGEDK